MSESYAKLFSTIATSTIWSEPLATRVVWITMLAIADRAGEVQASVPGLARVANVSMDECLAALATFLAPDAYSRTPDNEGRRIEVVDGGWRLLNHAKYRSKLDAEDRRERKAKWMADSRAKKKTPTSSTVGDCGQESPHESTQSTSGQSGHITDADAPTDAEEKISTADAVLVPGEQPVTNVHPLPAAPTCPHEAIIAEYHRLLPELPAVRIWDDRRQALLRSRWREDAERQAVAWWSGFFEYVRRCPFLLGQTEGRRDPFLADLEWLIRPQNFAKVIEGRYERAAGQA